VKSMAIRGSKSDLGEGSSDEKGRSRLVTRARLVDALTFLAVVLVSPASVVLSYPLGVMPQVWVEVWLRYVAVFIVLAFGLAMLGFGASNRYWLEAHRQLKEMV
jgi:cytochrome c biogenesis protein CcdA